MDCRGADGRLLAAVDNSDGFLNLQELTVDDWAAMVATQPHGLLGQTWRPVKVGGSKSVLKDVVEGDVDDYVQASGDVWAHEDVYNRFSNTQQ